MPVSFTPCEPNELPLEALTFLKRACDAAQLSVVTLDGTLQAAIARKTAIYLIKRDDDLIGCMTLSLRETSKDRFLELPLLSGVNLRSWRDDLVKFIFDQGDLYGCNRFTMIGRKGFERLYPELSLITCVYGRDLNLTRPL